jgi:hypothetical protein
VGAALAAAIAATGIAPARAQTASTPAEILQLRIAQIRDGVPVEIGGETIASTMVLPDFYERRGFQPVWSDPRAREELITALNSSVDDGLDPLDYHVAAIEERMHASPTPESEADLDLLATDGVVRLAYHLRFGKVDLTTLEPDWQFQPEEETELHAPPAAALERAVEKHGVGPGLDALRPSHWMYGALRRALKEYRAIESAGGWKSLADGPALKPGMADPRLSALEERLAAEGDLASAPRAGPAAYDSVLVAGVRRFQDWHGMNPDGVLGKATVRALNVPVATRISQLRIALERSRLLLHGLPERFVVVNIPGFRAFYIDGGRPRLISRVQVGKPFTQTPIFRADMTYAVLNPSWTIPPGIMKRDHEARRHPGDETRPGLPGAHGLRQGGEPDRPAAGTEQRAGPDQAHVPEYPPCLPARHAAPRAVRRRRPHLQQRLHPGREDRRPHPVRARGLGEMVAGKAERCHRDREDAQHHARPPSPGAADVLDGGGGCPRRPATLLQRHLRPRSRVPRGARPAVPGRPSRSRPETVTAP